MIQQITKNICDIHKYQGIYNSTALCMSYDDFSVTLEGYFEDEKLNRSEFIVDYDNKEIYRISTDNILLLFKSVKDSASNYNFKNIFYVSYQVDEIYTKESEDLLESIFIMLFMNFIYMFMDYDNVHKEIDIDIDVPQHFIIDFQKSLSSPRYSYYLDKGIIRDMYLNF